MPDSNLDDWQKERRVLLDLVQAHPSQDMAKERDRITLLNRMIAGHRHQANA